MYSKYIHVHKIKYIHGCMVLDDVFCDYWYSVVYSSVWLCGVLPLGWQKNPYVLSCQLMLSNLQIKMMSLQTLDIKENIII